MLTLIVGIFFIWLAYTKARQVGKSPVRSAVITAIVYMATVFLVPFSIGFAVFRLGIYVWGWSSDTVRQWLIDRQIFLTIVSLLTASLTSLLALRFLNKVSDKSFNEPPLPPKFE